MQRIYLPNTPLSEVLEISQRDIYHQLTRVLRARVGDLVIFFDGRELLDHLYKIMSIDKNTLNLQRKEIITKSEHSREMTLYQACPNKLTKYEMIIQKSCEVGYQSITFFQSERSQKLVLSEQKKERLKKIAIEAIEQCGGNIIPNIDYIDSFTKKSEESVGELYILCHTKGDKALSIGELKLGNKISVIVGPEGGFSPSEIENFSAQKVYFGERILRCETVSSVVGFYLQQKTQD